LFVVKISFWFGVFCLRFRKLASNCREYFAFSFVISLHAMYHYYWAFFFNLSFVSIFCVLYLCVSVSILSIYFSMWIEMLFFYCCHQCFLFVYSFTVNTPRFYRPSSSLVRSTLVTPNLKQNQVLIETLCNWPGRLWINQTTVLYCTTITMMFFTRILVCFIPSLFCCNYVYSWIFFLELHGLFALVNR